MTPSTTNLPSPRDKPGIIYLARNTVNGKCYVGQTTYPRRSREQSHNQAAKHGSTTAFHRAIRKHGVESFEFTTLQICCGFDCLNNAETWWIAYLNTTTPSGYNRTYGGQGRVTEEVREILRQKRRNQVVSEETRRKLKGRVVTDETREILREMSTGRKHTEATKKRLSELAKLRSSPERMKELSNLALEKGLSPQQLARRSKGLEEYRKSNPHPALGTKWTPERRAKKAMQVVTEETRQKQRASHLGKKYNTKSRRKIGETELLFEV